MKYVVLGSSSFYGSAFINCLYEHGETVIRFQRPQFNIFRDFELPDADFVFNFISSQEKHLLTNVLASCNLIERIPKGAVFFHISTPEVYGPSARWVKETRYFNPYTPYAVSRCAFDMMLMSHFKTKNFPVIITRTSNIYGRGQQPFRLIPKIFSTLLKGGEFPIHGNGKSVRAFIHVKDACEGLYQLSLKGSLGETYHISTQKTHSINEVVQRICRILNVPFQAFHEGGEGKNHAYLLNSNKVRDLGWYDKITFEEGLKDYADSLVVDQRSRGVSEGSRASLQSAS